MDTQPNGTPRTGSPITMVDAINMLKAKGYVEDFNIKQNCIECRAGEYKLFGHDFEIDEVFRFEDNTDPDDQAILYAISSEKYNLKGILVNAYGIYSEPITDEMLEKLKFHHD